MIHYELDYEIAGFVGTGPAKGYGSGYEQWRLLVERVSIRARWDYPPVEFNKYDSDGNIVSRRKNPSYFESDAPGCNFLSGRAANALRDLWERYGELLPLESRDGEFYVYHCTNEIDAVDPPRCEFDGMNIVKYVFKAGVVRGQDIFRPSFPWQWPIFVSQVVVDRVAAAGLKGFKFTPVWSEETGPIVEPRCRDAGAPRHATGHRRMSKSTRRDVVDNLLAMARKEWGIDVASDPPVEVLRRIHEHGESARAEATGIRECVGVGTVLGSLWGELVCREFGWEWVMVDGVAAIMSPTRSHVAFPHWYFHELVRFGGRGPKCAELYDMIRSGRLPAAEPDSYLVVT